MIRLVSGCILSAALVGTACSPTHGGASGRQGAAVVDPLLPAPDSVGPAPKNFSWRPVEGAASYAVGLWNESDALVWRLDDITTTSTSLPEDVRLDPGTYFWSVYAIRDGQQIATSGHLAFVVTVSR